MLLLPSKFLRSNQKGAPLCHQPVHLIHPRQIVELVRAGRSPSELAKEFEPTAQTIQNWVRQADRDQGLRADGLKSSIAERIRDRFPGRNLEKCLQR